MGGAVNRDSVGAAELNSDLEGGAGPASATRASDTWTGLACLLRELDADVRLGMAESGATWPGQGADAAKAAVIPFTGWAQPADELAVQTRRRTSSAPEFHSSATNGVPDQITTVSHENPFEAAASYLPGVTTDQETTGAAAATEDTQARQAMKTYDSSAYSDATGTWSSGPPTITAASTPPVPAPTDPGVPGGVGHGGTGGTGGSGTPSAPGGTIGTAAGTSPGATPGTTPGAGDPGGNPNTTAAVSSAGWTAPGGPGSVGAPDCLTRFEHLSDGPLVPPPVSRQQAAVPQQATTGGSFLRTT